MENNINLINLVKSENWQLLYNSDKKIIVDFTATWCGPCQRIAPLFKELSTQYKDILFLKVDVDEFEDIVEEMNISCMPTFLFLKNKNIIYKLEGGDDMKLKTYTTIFNEYIDQNSDSNGSSDSEKLI
jgi:thioredoxin